MGATPDVLSDAAPGGGVESNDFVAEGSTRRELPRTVAAAESCHE